MSRCLTVAIGEPDRYDKCVMEVSAAQSVGACRMDRSLADMACLAAAGPSPPDQAPQAAIWAQVMSSHKRGGMERSWR